MKIFKVTSIFLVLNYLFLISFIIFDEIRLSNSPHGNFRIIPVFITILYFSLITLFLVIWNYGKNKNNLKNKFNYFISIIDLISSIIIILCLILFFFTCRLGEFCGEIGQGIATLYYLGGLLGIAILFLSLIVILIKGAINYLGQI